MTVETPATGTQPSWLPDPTGRHQGRWFDGQTWTAHIVDNGVQGSDPLAQEAVQAGPVSVVPSTHRAASTNPVRLSPRSLLVAVGVLVVVLIAAGGYMLKRHSGATETAATATGDQITPEQLMSSIGCESPQPWFSSAAEPTAVYKCASSNSQDFVYFFATEGYEQAWMQRVLGYGDSTPIVVGPGWAVSTTRSDRVAAAVDAGGTIIR